MTRSPLEMQRHRETERQRSITARVKPEVKRWCVQYARDHGLALGAWAGQVIEAEVQAMRWTAATPPKDKP